MTPLHDALPFERPYATDVAFAFRLDALDFSYQRTIALAEALRCEASGMRLSAACARRRADVLGAVPGIMLFMAGQAS